MEGTDTSSLCQMILLKFSMRGAATQSHQGHGGLGIERSAKGAGLLRHGDLGAWIALDVCSVGFHGLDLASWHALDLNSSNNYVF